MSIPFEVQRNANPMPKAEREALLVNPVFGQNRTDHQVVCTWEKEKGWISAQVLPYGPIMLDPAAAVLHYAQEIFEGIKAYRFADGSIWTFRPHENAKRMQLSAQRMALPEVPEDIFVESLKQLIAVDADWVPDAANEKSLYIRPFEIAWVFAPPTRRNTASSPARLALISPAGSSPSRSGSLKNRHGLERTARVRPKAAVTTRRLWSRKAKATTTDARR